MSNTTRHTLGNLFSVLVVLAAGLFVVSLATRGLVSRNDDPLASVTTVPTASAQPVPPVPDKPAPDKAEQRHVRLVIDYGDGVQKHFIALPHTDGMSAFDALLAAKDHPRGIKLTHTGKGETAFVSAIDDLKNQGMGKDKKNWQFFINDTFGEQGAGAVQLRPDDVVKWVFDVYKGK